MDYDQTERPPPHGEWCSSWDLPLSEKSCGPFKGILTSLVNLVWIIYINKQVLNFSPQLTPSWPILDNQNLGKVVYYIGLYVESTHIVIYFRKIDMLSSLHNNPKIDKWHLIIRRSGYESALSVLFPLLLFTLYLSICFFIPSDYDTLKMTTIILVKKLFPFILHQYSSVSAINIIVSSFFLIITAVSSPHTLPFLPSHISSPATSPSPTSSSSSECASSLSPRKLQLYPSCRQPLLVSRWTIHNFDPHSLTDCQCPVWWPT